MVVNCVRIRYTDCNRGVRLIAAPLPRKSEHPFGQGIPQNGGQIAGNCKGEGFEMSQGDQAFSMSCPECGQDITQPLAWFQGDDRNCPACGAGLAFGDGVDGAITNAVDDFLGEIGSGPQ